jgi:hypothetical protein
MERLVLIPTAILEQEVTRLQIRIIHGIANDLEVESYCLIQVELGSREANEKVIDPRD